MRNLSLTLFSILLVLGLSSCRDYTQDEYEEYYVIESYQVVGRQLAPVLLTRTAPVPELYEAENQTISNAFVLIHLLEEGPGSPVETTFPLTLDDPGTYAASVDHEVLPGRTYQLEITISGSGEKVIGNTITPGAFEILPGVQDTVIYQGDEQLEVSVTPSNYPGRQNIFVFNTVSLNPVVQNLTPFFLDAYEDGDEEVGFYSKNSSGIINEGNFTSNPDGTFTLDYPWIGIAFYEENLLVVNTIDDNLYDFVRSQEVQLGGATLSPGEVQNVIYNIEGGIGVFGSLASDTVATFIRRNPNF